MNLEEWILYADNDMHATEVLLNEEPPMTNIGFTRKRIFIWKCGSIMNSVGNRKFSLRFAQKGEAKFI
jgi:hypothetical protein